MEPVSSVEVGTQLSGRVESIFVDFNDIVNKNQVLAILDTTQLHLDVKSAEASVIQSKAQLELSKIKLEDDQKLYKENYISEFELKSSKTDFATKKANLISAETKLEKARINLNKYAFIRSPITGKIIDKQVEKGQTVSASLSAPTLFLIAEDLSEMEIYAYIDETDIGLIKEGQNATFTVETYPEKEFTGLVKEVRLQPTTISNVVNYTVVLKTENHDNLLLPGMTATIEILTEIKEDVIIVENSALGVKPSREMLREMFMKNGNNRIKEDSSQGNSTRQRNGGYMSKMKDMKFLYYMIDETLAMIPVKTGSTDGSKTEVEIANIPERMKSRMKIDFDDLESGFEVIKKINLPKNQKESKTPGRFKQRGLF
jgi:HlyD family secretion protein